MTRNESGRWVIAGQPRPVSRDREALKRRGLIDWDLVDGLWTMYVTPKGYEQMADLEDTQP